MCCQPSSLSNNGRSKISGVSSVLFFSHFLQEVELKTLSVKVEKSTSTLDPLNKDLSSASSLVQSSSDAPSSISSTKVEHGEQAEVFKRRQTSPLRWLFRQFFAISTTKEKNGTVDKK
jgi:hypothetical protein